MYLQSGIKEHFPEIDLSTQKVGIWNKASKLDATPRDGDRIEIYRPLIADPKAVRKNAAPRKQSMSGRADKVTGGRPDAKRKAQELKTRMKLYIMRHGEAHYPKGSYSDRERRLTPEGEREVLLPHDG